MEQFKEILITCLLLLIMISILSSCTTVEIQHNSGELPRLRFHTLEKYCDDDFDADIDVDSVMLTCSVKL